MRASRSRARGHVDPSAKAGAWVKMRRSRSGEEIEQPCGQRSGIIGGTFCGRGACGG